MAFHGMFYRVETRRQTPQIAAIQERTREIWRRTPKYGFEPTVEAYAGALPADRRGIEFTTDIEPDGSPFEAKWYLTKTEGVELRVKDGEEFACITALTVANRQK
jgi:hypothetical protein